MPPRRADPLTSLWPNRELGTIEKMDASVHLQLRLDSGRTVTFKVDRHPHLD
jgi:hypothetical protein